MRAEAEEDPAETGDRGGDGERVELHAEHADAERRRRPFVGAHRDQSSAGSRPAQVGDDQAGEHESDEAHHRPTVRVVGVVDVDPEELAPSRRVVPPSNPSPIQSDLANTTAWIVKPRPSVTMARLTPRVRSAGQREQQPDRNGEQHAEGNGELHRHVEAQDERSRDQRAAPRQRPLARGRAGRRSR